VQRPAIRRTGNALFFGSLCSTKVGPGGLRDVGGALRCCAQYAAFGAAGAAALAEAQRILGASAAAGRNVGALAARVDRRAEEVSRYVESYRRHCWDVSSLDDLRLAPFHVLASQGHVHADKDHL
jgi:hypothetical protein